MNAMRTQRPLTNMQLEILKLYSLDLSEVDLFALKQALARHFAERLTQRVDAICETKGYTENELEHWLNEENQ